ncbi:cytochrome P450 [Cucurbitaria berberidis CBS 394.84]|uniref:Cytochrome P450 n=1 Tax=Cucurbitaria berberidis CBS 394.84 TaxID=1168544 RepID=A0A9P4L8B1_9PLEO|nr:cytochrome P450 [Cucurbitaria berberidis CBS 394.84]KAF1845152.1 cytochrome P450 [Cucurbitaria berberidis CBS 394.84]
MIVSLTSCILVIGRFVRSQDRLREPPCVPPSIPIPHIGHLIGIMKRRMQYFSDIGVTLQEPIAKISILGTNFYIIGSVKIMPFIERQPRVLSSRSWFAKFVCTLVGCSKRSLGNFEANLGATTEGDSMLLEGVRTTKRILNSKTGADMNYDAARIVSERFKTMETPNPGVELNLFEWVKHEILYVLSESTYGPENPFWDSEVEAAFWYVTQHTLALCVTSFLPKCIVSKLFQGMRGREFIVKALDEYLRSGHLVRGSPIVNAHYPIFKAKLDDRDVARFECASALGSFANTVPTSFWTIFHIFADANLLTDVRNQVSAITTTVTSEDGRSIHRIDLRRLRTATILFSAVEEVSRYRATGIGVRLVTENIVVGDGDNRYYLKKGGWLIIANQALHSDKNVWGKDADKFVASRFNEKTPHLSFRGFGNGASACCGKNLALYHIASFMAIMVMRYDISPVEGVWKEPEQDGRDTAAQVAGPVHKPMVRMTLREDVKATWDFSF